MNLRHLKTLCEVVDSNLKISDAAGSLFRSQSSVSRQIQDLEKELGLQILKRNKNRIIEVTAQGHQVVIMARRILNEVENLSRLSKDLINAVEGTFTIATTHTQALYTLPAVLRKFRAAYPKVILNIRQAGNSRCHELVAEQGADMAVCTEHADPLPDLIEVPCYRMSRSVIAPPGHPLLRQKNLTLENLAKYPIMSYDEKLKSRWMINNVFHDHGIKPDMIFNGIDVDVSKKLVAMGFGVAIIATATFDKKRDSDLRRMDASHLFPAPILNAIFRQDVYLRGFMLDFVHMLAPHLRKTDIASAATGLPRSVIRKIPEI